MNILVTAGNTQVLIDRVRCLTNIFTGRTGARIALEAHERGHSVTLLTSRPEAIAELGVSSPAERWCSTSYRTFDDLRQLMSEAVVAGGYDAIIHSAAVSDYLSAGVYGLAETTSFDQTTGKWHGDPPRMIDRRAGKVKSSEPELWLRLVRAPKLVDLVRRGWGFRGVLVKFKLEVDVNEERLLRIAEESRRQSGADLMAANTLDGAAEWALLGPLDSRYERLSRAELSPKLLDAVERLHASRTR